MHPPLNTNSGKPSKTCFFGNYYNDNNPSNPTASSSCSYDLLPSPIYIPLEDEAVFCDFFQQQHFFSSDHNNYHNINILANLTESTMEECGNNNEQVAMNDGDHDHCDFNDRVERESSSPRKRPSKGNRHSKINTAQGSRDRRMRLSLDVAKKLFGLQDLLGFDKASKTVDWLLTKSKTAIQELLPDQSSSFNSASSTSECEVVSSEPNQEITTKSKAKSCSESSKKPKEKSVRRCPDYHHPVAKATRERARARARERTLEKRNFKHDYGSQDSKFKSIQDQQLNQDSKFRSIPDQDSKFKSIPDQQVDQDLYPLGSWKPYEENQRKSIGQHDQLTSNGQFKQGFVGDSWSPSYLFNYQHSSGLTHEHQYNNDFQIIGKAWEGTNN